ncbi:MAG: hypothetical protein METHP_01993 [Methanoregula sp. SKADARSKE-2]|nr:MAG: hypothetical protein METHP_01993 [Methanoregula sp. SKADARSKE-2]
MVLHGSMRNELKWEIFFNQVPCGFPYKVSQEIRSFQQSTLFHCNACGYHRANNTRDTYTRG